MRFLFLLAFALACSTPQQAKADIVLAHDVSYELVYVDTGLTIQSSWSATYLHGAYGSGIFTGANPNAWALGDSYGMIGVATNGVDPEYGQRLTMTFINDTENDLTASFNVDGELFFGLGLSLPRELTADASIILEDENGGLDYFDFYNKSLNSAGYSETKDWPNNFLQEVLIPAGETRDLDLFLNGKITGDATNAVPEPATAIIAGGFVGWLFLRDRRRRRKKAAH